MKKKIMSILLSCLMAFGTGNPIHAEELTGVSSPESILPDSSVEEQTADTDYTAYQDEMLIDTDQVQPDFSDEAFPMKSLIYYYKNFFSFFFFVL